MWKNKATNSVLYVITLTNEHTDCFCGTVVTRKNMDQYFGIV